MPVKVQGRERRVQCYVRGDGVDQLTFRCHRGIGPWEEVVAMDAVAVEKSIFIFV